MINKLSFKEYIETKQYLREAAHNTPQQTKMYTVKRYCRLMVGKSKNNKNEIVLKPKQHLKVRWIYENLENPIPLSILVENQSTKLITYWSGKKLSSWLQRNTLESSSL